MVIINTDKSSIAKAVLSGFRMAHRLTDLAGFNVVILDKKEWKVGIYYSYPWHRQVNTHYVEKWITWMDRNSLPSFRQQIDSFSEIYKPDLTGVALFNYGEIVNNLNPFVLIVFFENDEIKLDFVILGGLIDFWKNKPVKIKNGNISKLRPYYEWSQWRLT